jgi:hypothetical protein
LFYIAVIGEKQGAPHFSATTEMPPLADLLASETVVVPALPFLVDGQSLMLDLLHGLDQEKGRVNEKQQGRVYMHAAAFRPGGELGRMLSVLRTLWPGVHLSCYAIGSTAPTEHPWHGDGYLNGEAA